jgi:predicted transcriptional regulator
MNTKEYLQTHSLDESFVVNRGWELKEDQIIIPIFDIDGKFLYNKYRHLTGDARVYSRCRIHILLFIVC